MSEKSYTTPPGFVIAIFIALLLGLYLTSLYSYQLFHCFAEIFSIIVAFGIFTIAWNSRHFLDNNYLLFLGFAYLFVGFIDLLHTMSYKGVSVFPDYGTDLPTQLWIAARYMESLSLLLAPLFLKRKFNIPFILSVYLAVTAILLAMILYWKIFPICYVEPQGLTAFKKVSEYIISALLAGSIVVLQRNRQNFDDDVHNLLLVSIMLTIASELAFTFYVSVFGLSNLIGHMLKIISFFLIYKAIVQTGLSKPFNLLFRDLKKNEESLRHERNKLSKALSEIKNLSGLLPICSNCKKIRDDRGYWNQIEAYIRDHSDAEFSHGICPDCVEELYPKLMNPEGSE